MNTIIFSDTHLTEIYNPQFFSILKQVISQADRIIINGDFWDGYLTDFNSFINSEWKNLFPLLKQKNTIYIYGNHDPKLINDQRTQLFSNIQTNQYELNQGKYHYYIQHGHLIYSSWFSRFATLFPHTLVKKANLWLEYRKQTNPSIRKISELIEKHLDKDGDEKLVAYTLKRKKSKNDLYIYGHTHLTRMIPEIGYINPGRFSLTKPNFIKITDTRCEIASI